MAFPSIQSSFVAGELAPSLFGSVHLAKYHVGCSTLRNFYVAYTGGASSRAGLLYVGMCKQGAPNSGGTSTVNPPRDIAFQYSIDQGFVLEFGDQYMRVKFEGAYVTEAPTTISGATIANPLVITDTAHGYSDGDWIFISGMRGMTQLNGRVWIVTGKTANTYRLTDLFGNSVNSSNFSAYTSGGTAARIYTAASPYAAIDVPYLKFTQSANVMSLCCVNSATGTEYPSYDLQRVSNTDWVFTQAAYAAAIAAPASISVAAHSSTSTTTFYSYVVTAVNANGEESVASSVGTVINNDIAINAGSNTITWAAVSGAVSYNIYASVPSYSVTTPVGAAFGYLGSAFGTQFTDTNITADFTQVPPTHQDPFARGQILYVNPTAGGSSYTQATIGFTITTSTGSGFSGVPIVVGGAFVGFFVENNGSKYANTDTITITDSGSGSGATATLTFGAQTGTYPSVAAYFQQRRGYANTLSEPDTYFFSKPGQYLNMDFSAPSSSDDAIIGTPWAQQINGIQWLMSMPNGLVVLTGNGGWLLSGSGNGVLTPSSQLAIQQANVGASALVPPILVNSDILYVQAKNSIVRDLTYNFFTNIYMGEDKTVLANHLFANFSILQWAWCEEPYKLMWAVRDDGALLSLTWLKEQDIWGWARHDTNGAFVGACSATQRHLADIRAGIFNGPITDAPYFITRRTVNGVSVYYSEQMDDRNWFDVEDCFCVDAGLVYPMSFPNATLTASAATGSAVTFTASASVFTPSNVGDVIRMGGGKATVTGYTSGTQVVANITQAITETVPDNSNNTPYPATAGDWSITTPTTAVSGLDHLEGLQVAILADGSVVPNQTVTGGRVTLPSAASAIAVGLPYTPQMQTMYLDPPGQPMTVQGRRKLINAVTLRVENTRGLSVGVNQPDASTQPDGAIAPWSGLTEIKPRSATNWPGTAIPLFTGDVRALVSSSWEKPGQIALQQNYPLAANVLAVIPEFQIGDSSG